MICMVYLSFAVVATYIEVKIKKKNSDKNVYKKTFVNVE